MNLTALALLLTFIPPGLAVLMALVTRNKASRLEITTAFFSALSLLGSLGLAWIVISVRQPMRMWWFYLDSLSVFFIFLVNLVAFFASIYAIQFLRFDARTNPQNHRPRYFHGWLNAFHLTMLLVPMVDNLVLLWVMVELTTVASAMLVRYKRGRLELEAAWKFIMITTAGIIFALLGTMFLMKAYPEAHLRFAWGVLAHEEVARGLAHNPTGMDPTGWQHLTEMAMRQRLEPSFVMLSFLFVLIGYGTKAGFAPMHTWLPDGHGQAPVPVSALLSGVMLKSALYAILRFFTITNLALEGSPQETFALWLVRLAGLVSLALAAPFILKRNGFKRVLAYHSLEHMGIIAFGVGIGTPLALFGALLHALNHAVTKALMFLIYGSIRYQYAAALPTGEQAEENEEGIKGVLQAMPVSGTILALGGLALVGSPPFNIFMSEFLILWAAFSRAFQMTGTSAFLFYASIALFFLTVTLIFGGMVGHLARLLLGTPTVERVKPGGTAWYWLAPFVAILLLILLFGVTIPSVPIDFRLLITDSAEIVIRSGGR